MEWNNIPLIDESELKIIEEAEAKYSLNALFGVKDSVKEHSRIYREKSKINMIGK